MIGRAFAAVCLLAACSSPQRGMAGRTEESAIELQLMPGKGPDILTVERDGSAIPLPHWYRLKLVGSARVTATAKDRDHQTFQVDMLAADGSFVSLAPTLRPDEPMTGELIIRVDGHTPPYRLHVEATAVHPYVEPPVDAGIPPCDPLNVDQANPSCAAVIPCDANKPDLKNSSCCASCTKCEGKLVRDAGKNEGWLDIGSTHGLTRRHRLETIVTISGKPETTSAFVLQVERDRSRVVIAKDLRLAAGDSGGEAYVLLLEPFECSRQFRYHVR
jgi:hypothetical protein